MVSTGIFEFDCLTFEDLYKQYYGTPGETEQLDENNFVDEVDRAIKDELNLTLSSISAALRQQQRTVDVRVDFGKYHSEVYTKVWEILVKRGYKFLSTTVDEDDKLGPHWRFDITR